MNTKDSAPLQGKHIILGLTGGIACYKSAMLCRLLKQAGARVTVVMTPAACDFITPTTMQALSGQAVFTHTQDARMADSMAHIHLSRQADLILVAPCSADFMAKLAQGQANDLLSTLCLGKGSCPLAIAPAMNREMWAHPATQRNRHLLHSDGVQIWGPDHGEQACGEVGEGRMWEPSALLEATIAFFTPKALAGRRVLITAGPTQEPIDPVRVLSNVSSGKMGYAIAQAAWRAGAHVQLITGPTALPIPMGVQAQWVQTAQQMYDAVLPIASQYDIFIAVAAVADWAVANYQPHKQKKQQGELALDLRPNPDIVAAVAALPQAPYCVGFAAETQHLNEYAQAKRLRKSLPLIVGNLAQDVMGQDHTQLCLFDDQGEHPLPPQSKAQAAQSLVAAIAQRLSHRCEAL